MGEAAAGYLEGCAARLAQRGALNAPSDPASAVIPIALVVTRLARWLESGRYALPLETATFFEVA